MTPGLQLRSSTKVPARILDQICQVSSQDCGIVLSVLLLGLPIGFNLVVLSSGFFPFPLTFLLVSSCQMILCVQNCLTYPVFQHEPIVRLLPLLLQIGLLLLKWRAVKLVGNVADTAGKQLILHNKSIVIGDIVCPVSCGHALKEFNNFPFEADDGLLTP